MHKKSIFFILLIPVLFCILLFGCAGKKNGTSTPSSKSPSGSSGSPSTDSADKNAGKESAPLRDSTPVVLVPEASGTVTYANDVVTIDASHTDQGYIMVQYLGTNGKVKMQVKGPDGVTYTYLLSQEHKLETFPFTAGNGTYSLSILENVSGDTYAIAFTQEIAVDIADEFTPFLYPNQYVQFTAESKTVKKGESLAKKAHSDLDVVKNIYHYIIENISYDKEKAENVSYGYLPNVDKTLESHTGICFDYAAIMTAMLRSQRIPTKLEIGYAGEIYHAWISTYIEDIGWIDNIIEFDGTSWKLMDPTFAANTSKKSLKKFIGGGSNYMLKYSY